VPLLLVLTHSLVSFVALQATLAEAEAADGERKSLGEQLAAAKKAAKELEKQVGGWVGGWVLLCFGG